MNKYDEEMQLIEQCREDRATLLEIKEMNEKDRKRALESIGTVAVHSLFNNDYLKVAKRLEKLYASISISSYEDYVSLQMIDDLQNVALDSLGNFENEDASVSVKNSLIQSRTLGLNPIYR